VEIESGAADKDRGKGTSRRNKQGGGYSSYSSSYSYSSSAFSSLVNASNFCLDGLLGGWLGVRGPSSTGKY
jgi:hypothetical protein